MNRITPIASKFLHPKSKLKLVLLAIMAVLLAGSKSKLRLIARNRASSNSLAVGTIQVWATTRSEMAKSATIKVHRE